VLVGGDDGRDQSRRTSPLAKPLKKPDTTWVEPRFGAEITDDGMVRHPVFKSLFARTRSGKLRAS